MATIYLIRHAESIANTLGIYQGQSYDTDLSELGKKQAAALGARFADVQLDAIFTSPLIRTFQTASELGIPESHDQLLETNHGDWEGKTKTQIGQLWPDTLAQWLTTPQEVEFPRGEKFTETANRVITWFNDLFNKSGTYAVVTHANIIQIVLTHLFKTGLENIWGYTSQPTAVTLLETNSPAKVVYYNDTSHLNALQSDLTTQAL